MIGDISGSAGVKAVAFGLSKLKKDYNPSIVIANAENSASGYGISKEACEQLFRFGVDVITTGNHAFECAADVGIFDQYDRLLRPDNFYSGNIGHGSCVFETDDRLKIGVVNLHAPSGIGACDSLYSVGLKTISRIRKETPIIFIDLHGEIPSQKEAFSFEVAGKATAVCGTHTHVQTLDEKIVPGGTAYITDLGMTGVQDSIIGGSIELSLQRMLTSVPIKVPPAEGDGRIMGCAIEFDGETGLALSIRRL